MALVLFNSVERQESIVFLISLVNLLLDILSNSSFFCNSCNSNDI